MAESLLTASDVAQLFKFNVATVSALLATKGLPAATIGGQWRCEAPRIQAWVRTCYVVQECDSDTPTPAPKETFPWSATTPSRVVQETARDCVGSTSLAKGRGTKEPKPNKDTLSWTSDSTSSGGKLTDPCR